MSDENKAIKALYAEALRIRVNAGQQQSSSAPNTASPKAVPPSGPAPNTVSSTAIPPVPGPAPLKVFPTVKRAYESVISDIGEFVRRSWLFIVIIMVMFGFIKMNFASDPALIFCFIALNLVANVSLFTCWVRRQSGLPPGGFAILHLRCGLRELKVLGVLLLGVVPSSIASGVVFIAANIAVGEPVGLLGGILVFALVYVRGPMMMAVAIAQDRFRSIGATWKRGRGKMWKSVTIVALTVLPLSLIGMALTNLFGFAVDVIARLASIAILAAALQEIDSSA